MPWLQFCPKTAPAKFGLPSRFTNGAVETETNGSENAKKAGTSLNANDTNSVFPVPTKLAENCV